MKVDDMVTLELRMAAVDSTLAPEDHLDPSKNPKLRRAFIKVTSETDFIAKVDVTDLPSNTNFVFAFLGKFRKLKNAIKSANRDFLTLFLCSYSRR
jgi:hypothetical protein